MQGGYKMKVNISSVDNLLFIQNHMDIRDNNNIEILSLDASTIPHLDLFIERCKELNGNVMIKKELLIKLKILEHFKNRVQVL